MDKQDAQLDLKGIYRAKVLDNTDPLQYGRIKAEIYPAMAGLVASELPWAVPAFGLFCGSGQDYGSFFVPDVGTFVFVFFEDGDLYQPVYFAEAPTAQKGLPPSRTTNYPNRRVIKTAAGIEIIVDDIAPSVTLNHPTGTSIVIASNGKITITSVDDVKFVVAGDFGVDADTITFVET